MDTHEIRAVHAVLHLIYHRNKNQHQPAKWWKWLSRLKRTAGDLGSQEASVAIQAAQKQYLAAHLIPRCYLYEALSYTCAEDFVEAGDGRAIRIRLTTSTGHFLRSSPKTSSRRWELYCWRLFPALLRQRGHSLKRRRARDRRSRRLCRLRLSRIAANA